jgi:hypothetical protein
MGSVKGVNERLASWLFSIEWIEIWNLQGDFEAMVYTTWRFVGLYRRLNPTGE